MTETQEIDLQDTEAVREMLSGSKPHGIPGPGDTACCGSSPGQNAGCAGPGSCCGKGP